MIARVGAVCLIVALALTPRAADAQAFADIGVDEHPGVQLSLDLTFRDARGDVVTLGDLLDEEMPTVLVLAYYACPLLCDQVLGGLVSSLREARIAAAVDYRVLAISFDPADTPATAAEKERTILDGLSGFERARWRFAVDQDGSARRLADALGFRYRPVPSSGQFAHPAVIFTVAPGGRLTQYLYGVSFEPDTLVSALADGAAGRTRSTVERVLLRCFQYVPAVRAHGAAVAWILRGGTLMLFAGFGVAIVWLVRRERGGTA